VAEASVIRSSANVTPWPISIIAIALGLTALVLLFWPTAAAAVHQWDSSSAYSYAYLIAPISLYVIWSERSRLAVVTPDATFWCAGICAAFVLAWLLADALDINEGRQIALIGMMQALFVGVLGWRVYRALLFPLLYLFLLVPTGEFLLGPLQGVAHAGSVWMLKASGIPTYAEGILIEVPAGLFEVAPGCAGLNFVLTALALSLLYGFMFYRGWRARALCVFVGLATAIIANIVRIYLIIALAQFTDRAVDITDDHLLWGWGFFAVIMLALMWFGLRFAKPALPRPLPASGTFSAVRMAAAVVLVVGISGTGLLLAQSAPITRMAETITAHAPFLMKQGPTE